MGMGGGDGKHSFSPTFEHCAFQLVASSNFCIVGALNFVIFCPVLPVHGCARPDWHVKPAQQLVTLLFSVVD